LVHAIYQYLYDLSVVLSLLVDAVYGYDGGSKRSPVYVLLLNADDTVKAEQ